MAVLATVIARSAGSKTARPDHFIPDFTKGIRKQSPQEIMAKFDKYTKGLGRV